MLDLDDKDLIELTEGRHQILEATEPKELVDKIVDNLVIIKNKDTR